MLPASSERGCDCTVRWAAVRWERVQPSCEIPAVSHCWNPDREWRYFVFWCTSRVPIALIKQILRKTLEYCLSGITFNGFCHSPQPFSHLGCFQRGIGYFYYLFCVNTQSIAWNTGKLTVTVSCQVTFCHDYSNFSYFCMLPLCWPATLTYPRCCCSRKCLQYSDLITVNMESISFCLKLKSVVLISSVFPISFIFCTILLCSLSIFGFFFPS